MSMHFLLFYKKGEGYAARQAPYVEAHLAYLQALVESGALLLAGSMENPVDGSAMLLFQADTAKEVEEFAKRDPYVVHGIISHWEVRHWDTVLGTLPH